MSFTGCSVLAAAVGPSLAAAAPFAASVGPICCAEKLESGATERQYFMLTNTGTETWGASGGPRIALGTYEPTKPSVFASPSWASPELAVVGVSSPVPPGASYKFAFEVKAPPVSAPTTLTQGFGLFAETSKGNVWMTSKSKHNPLALTFEVLPAQPPAVSLSVASASVRVGAPLAITASATAVASVNRVVISFDGSTVTGGPPRSAEIAADEQRTWTTSGSFSTAGLGPGPQTVTATAFDDAGLSATTSAAVTLLPTLLPVVPEVRMFLTGSSVSNHPGELRLKRVTVIGTTRGETVRVRCEHCYGVSRLGPLTAKGDEVVLPTRHLLVTNRSRLLVYVTGFDNDGRFKEYAVDVGGGSTPLRRQGCLKPNSVARSSCPR
jgi:hypothetical protein